MKPSWNFITQYKLCSRNGVSNGVLGSFKNTQEQHSVVLSRYTTTSWKTVIRYCESFENYLKMCFSVKVVHYFITVRRRVSLSNWPPDYLYIIRLKILDRLLWWFWNQWLCRTLKHTTTAVCQQITYELVLFNEKVQMSRLVSKRSQKKLRLIGLQRLIWPLNSLTAVTVISMRFYLIQQKLKYDLKIILLLFISYRFRLNCSEALNQNQTG